MPKAKHKPLKRGLAPLHPGEQLLDTIEFLSLTKAETARTLGISRQYLDKIIKGQASITAPVAARMAVAFGTTARIWLALQNDYDLWHYRQEHQQELDSIKAYA